MTSRADEQHEDDTEPIRGNTWSEEHDWPRDLDAFVESELARDRMSGRPPAQAGRPTRPGGIGYGPAPRPARRTLGTPPDPNRRAAASEELEDLDALAARVSTPRRPVRRLGPPPDPVDDPRRRQRVAGTLLVALLSILALLVGVSSGILRTPSPMVMTTQGRADINPPLAHDAISTTSTLPVPAMPAGFAPLPEAASDASWPLWPDPADLRTVNPLDAGTPYRYEGVRQGNRCQIRLPGSGPSASGGGQLWITCRVIGVPMLQATAAPPAGLVCREAVYQNVAGAAGPIVGRACATNEASALAAAHADAQRQFPTPNASRTP